MLNLTNRTPHTTNYAINIADNVCQGFKKMLILFFACLFIIAPQFSIADVPEGKFEVDIDNTKIWDISGFYIENSAVGDVKYALIMDDAGRITGSGNASGSVNGRIIKANLEFVGRLKGPRTKMRLTMSGTLEADNGLSKEYYASTKITQEINENTHTAMGIGTAKLCVEGTGCRKMTEDYSYNLKGGMDGTWNIEMDLRTSGTNKLSGNGKLTLSNGDPRLVNIAGKHSSKNDTAKLQIKGSSGLKVAMTAAVVDTMLKIEKLKGKVMGQKLKF